MISWPVAADLMGLLSAPGQFDDPGGEVEQIMFLLERCSVHSVERFFGANQELQTAANDNLGFE